MRSLKKEVSKILEQKDFVNKIGIVHNYPTQKLINPLISLLCSTDSTVKTNTIIAIGEVVSKLAENDIESARKVMRRLIWSLNEESGWIGWGSAQAMGEIMARNNTLAEEYHKILISYISEGENYLWFDELRKEVISGLKRLSQVHPHLVKDVKHLLN